MTLNDLLGNRKPKACTGSGFASRRINPEKRLEYARHALLGNARPLIIDGNRSGAVFQTDRYKGAAAMGCGIDDQISYGSRQR